MFLNVLQQQNIEKPDVVIFDWDNTLVDSWGIILSSLNSALDEFGMEHWSMEEIKSGKQGIHHSLKESMHKIFGENAEDALSFYRKNFLVNHLDFVKSYQHSEHILSTLQNIGVNISVASNKMGESLREEVNHLGWSSYFENIVGAGDTEKSKPSAQPILKAIEKFNGLSKEKTWMIGDSLVDVQAAKQACVVPILYHSNEYMTFDVFKHLELKKIYSYKCHKEFAEFALQRWN